MNISPITIWNNGKQEIANIIIAQSNYDNLLDTADFYYYLGGDNNTKIISGYIKISGEDYQLWGNSSDINLAAYQYICNKLNLTLIF